MTNHSTKVIIADDELISRGYMELLIKPAPKYEVTASLPLAESVLNYCRKGEVPDIAIMDVLMKSGPDGITVAQRIKAEFPEVKIILVTSMADEGWIEKAQDAGVESFWFKTYSDMPLLEVLDRTVAGEKVYPVKPPQVNLGKLPASELTPQQRNILRLMTSGMSNQEIADRLHISANTVKWHIDALMDRADIHSRTALVARASRIGIVISEKERLGKE